MVKDKKILLIIAGGVAAYKSLELIRLLRKNGADVKCILSRGGAEFITPLSVSSLSGNNCYTNLFSLKDETEMGHIRLSREADIIVIAPASANMMAKMANGIADDLATTTLLASNKPIIAVPAMNHMMWNNPATQNNIEKLKSFGIKMIGPEIGDMACNESGMGRMSEPEYIYNQISKTFANKPLEGKHALVTSGPTYEPIDPVRFIGNKSSGKQGHAIAKSLRDAGAKVTLITGPVALPDPNGMAVIHVETAFGMMEACKESLPADIAVFAAAVSDWKIKNFADNKIKKNHNSGTLKLELSENEDILAFISSHPTNRPEIVIGFAAETENIIENGKEKLARKKCDLLLANDVSPKQNVFNGEENQIYCISHDKIDQWERMGKDKLADRLTIKITNILEKEKA